MAISINDVYQKVLAIANKEQRGYITPLEFNLFADHAQKDIFRQYFYDLDQAKRHAGNNTNYADVVTSIEEKISMFEIYDEETQVSSQDGEVDISSEKNLYKLTSVKINYTGTNDVFIHAAQVQLKEIAAYENSPLLNHSTANPYYVVFSSDGIEKKIKLYPQPTPNDEIRISYVREPLKPNWTYVISGEAALFNQDVHAGWQDFELHSSEENMLVLKILQLAGVSIKDYNLTQAAAQEEVKKIQLEKS